MKQEGICFNKNEKMTGVFNISNVGNFFGKFTYTKNEKFEFYIYVDQTNVPESIDNINATLSDENDNIYFVTLINCHDIKEFDNSSGIRILRGFLDKALFSKQRIFDLSNENINGKVNIYINLWNEFCFPQGHIRYAQFQPKESSFKLKNKMRVSFNQSISGHFLTQNNIFNSLFTHQNIPDNVVNKLETQLNQVLMPHRNDITIKNPQEHNWYIHFENIPEKLGIFNLCFAINNLIKCFSYNFGSEINKIEIISKNPIQNVPFEDKFDFLYSRNIINETLHYHYGISAFNFNTFIDTEWKTILNNLFSKYTTIEPFFNILVQNHFEKGISEYHLERYIDCISAIGQNKKYGNTKYEQVLENFVSDLDRDIRINLLNRFRQSFSSIKLEPNQKKYKKRNWGRIGIQISNLRALTTHFNETSKRVSVDKYLYVYHIFELIIIDYIFELLEINKNKRLDYKNKYINNII